MNTSQDLPQRFDFGKHSVIYEKDRIFHFLLRGNLSRGDTQEVQRLIFEYADRYGSFAFLVDVSTMSGLDPAARQLWARPVRSYPFDAAYLYGSSFAIRTLILSVYRAGKLLLPHFFQWQIVMPPDEATARKVIANERSVNKSQSPKP